MKVTVFPGKANGETAAPPSKSMSHRLLMAGALSQGSVIEGLDFSDDVEATLSCIKGLGAAVTREGSAVRTGGLLSGCAAERPVIK